MMGQILKTSLVCVGVGYLSQVVQSSLDSEFLNHFLSCNLVNLLVALLAINTATLGIVLTKIRDLVERYGSPESFQRTRAQCLLSVREQLALIVVAIVLLTVSGSSRLTGEGDLRLVINTLVAAVFAYAIHILYDTAISVFVIIDFHVDSDE